MKKYAVLIKEVASGFEWLQEIVEASSITEAKKIATRNNLSKVLDTKHIVRVISKAAYLKQLEA